MKHHYEQISDNEWFKPTHNKHREQCCHCGLVHVTDYKVDEQGNIWVRSKQDHRATAAVRRGKKFSALRMALQEVENG